jgi:hypothetical protein
MPSFPRVPYFTGDAERVCRLGVAYRLCSIYREQVIGEGGPDFVDLSHPEPTDV